MKAIYLLLASILFSLLSIRKARAQDGLSYDNSVLAEGPYDEYSSDIKSDSSFFSSFFVEPKRITLRHEVSYKFEDPSAIKNNRFSLLLEYSKYLLDNFYIKLDSKLNAFWIKDHRAEADNEKIAFQNNFIEGFLQFSIKQTSIKAGVQKMIWGESEAGAITDVISPRDYSELFFISLEESRRGQPMISVDQFTKIGDWTVFFVPFPAFNRYPLKGTAYYFDPFNGNARYRDEKTDKGNFEYGLKWKKTFGSSDISLMSASLIDNDYAFRADGYSADGLILVTRMKQRFNIAGMTLNYTFGDFILKGEAAVKLKKSYNSVSYQIVKRNAIDAALVLDYTPKGGSLALSLEAVNSHTCGWNDEIQIVPRNIYSLVFTWNKTFFNQNLSIFGMTIYTSPYTSFLHKLMLSYKLSDHITLFLDGFYPDVRDERNTNWRYSDQKQVDFKIQYQF